jgi:hypothetical protein
MNYDITYGFSLILPNQFEPIAEERLILAKQKFLSKSNQRTKIYPNRASFHSKASLRSHRFSIFFLVPSSELLTRVLITSLILCYTNGHGNIGETTSVGLF